MGHPLRDSGVSSGGVKDDQHTPLTEEALLQVRREIQIQKALVAQTKKVVREALENSRR